MMLKHACAHTGEDLLREIGQCLEGCRADRLDREGTLLRLASTVDGVYVPQFYEAPEVCAWLYRYKVKTGLFVVHRGRRVCAPVLRGARGVLRLLTEHTTVLTYTPPPPEQHTPRNPCNADAPMQMINRLQLTVSSSAIHARTAHARRALAGPCTPRARACRRASSAACLRRTPSSRSASCRTCRCVSLPSIALLLHCCAVRAGASSCLSWLCTCSFARTCACTPSRAHHHKQAAHPINAMMHTPFFHSTTPQTDTCRPCTTA
jgi:hypothetical protein